MCSALVCVETSRCVIEEVARTEKSKKRKGLFFSNSADDEISPCLSLSRDAFKLPLVFWCRNIRSIRRFVVVDVLMECDGLSRDKFSG